MHPPDDPGFASIQQRAAEWNSPLISVPDRGATDRKVITRMLKLLKHYSVKIWHGHDYKSNMLGLMLRPLHKMKLVTTVHGWVKHTSKTPLYYTIDRWCLPYYHHVICVSDDLLERIRELRVPDERLTLIHNAIDERTFRRQHAPSQSPLRGKLGTPAGRLVIGAVGRLSAEKGFNHLIRATKTLVDRGVDCEVWIAGTGDAHDELQQLIEKLGMQDRARLLGFVSDTVELYHGLDMFVLSSLREGLPNVVLEAASMSVPIVSTRVAGVPKMLTDGEDALLCPIGNVEQLTETMHRLATDVAMRQRFAAAGRALIERRYSFTQRMAKVRAIYDQLLGLARPAEVPSTSASPI